MAANAETVTTRGAQRGEGPTPESPSAQGTRETSAGPPLRTLVGPAGRQRSELSLDAERAAQNLRHQTLVGLALCSVLPLLMLAYVISWYVLPVIHPQDTMTFLALQVLLLAAMVIMVTGGYSMLDYQTNQIARFVAQLETARRGLADANERLQELSFKDPVTGLYNRRFFMIRLEDEISRYRRFGHPVSVVLLDLDGFKAVNDKLGHAVGDDTLRDVARVLVENSRGINVLARYGGDEFAVLLVEADRAGARDYAERMRALLAEHRFEHGMPVTGSFGVAAVPTDGTLNPDALLHIADEALYAAKRGGKNQVATDTRAARPTPEPR